MTKWNYQELEAIPEEGISRVVEILRSGNIFRYSSAKPEESEAALFERDFLEQWGGALRYALAVNSGSSAILLALKALGVGPGDKVLVPAFTFTAVPSAVENLHAEPVLVECGMDFKVDIEDLEVKIARNPEAKVFLLSHMRGWISDMGRILEICDANGITIIEDAAHALGSWWGHRLVGTFGKIATYSFQSYKIINAGEGGMVTTDDPDLFARMLFDQGAYENLFERHLLKPGSDVLKQYLNQRPLYNMRMSNMTAAIARCQLPLVEGRIEAYKKLYDTIVRGLSRNKSVQIPKADRREIRVLDSIQFRLKDFTPEMMKTFIEHVRSCGVPLAAFAVGDNARAPWNWKYIAGIGDEAFPKTHRALDTACDMRITTMLDDAHCEHLLQSVFAGIQKAVEVPVAG
ncbi:MAG TPA: aminotransferase class I/II-fold pyridoxal phosphate-dependent enzyme [Candidatus Paceibacterota bacterium]